MNFTQAELEWLIAWGEGEQESNGLCPEELELLTRLRAARGQLAETPPSS